MISLFEQRNPLLQGLVPVSEDDMEADELLAGEYQPLAPRSEASSDDAANGSASDADGSR